MDNDAYGHVNNVTYYSYFDTVVNEHLIRQGGLDIAASPVVGLVAETSCTFRKPLAFPERIDAGLRVTRIGTSSVVYEVGLFREADDEAAAVGRFVHVWVDRVTQRPQPVPAAIRAALGRWLRRSVAHEGEPRPGRGGGAVNIAPPRRRTNRPRV